MSATLNGRALTVFRNSRGEAAPSFSASDAKKEFGRVLDETLSAGVVTITKHETIKAVMLSVDEYERLTRPRSPQLDALSAEFDAMFERMQEPGQAARVHAAMSASPAELGKAAVHAARKRQR